MNIQEQVNISDNLRQTIYDFVEHLSNIWYNTEEDMLSCPYQVVSNFSGNWYLKVVRGDYHTGFIHTTWEYSEAWEDNDDEDTFDIPVEWLQWFVDGELEELSKAFLEECEKYSKELYQDDINRNKGSLEFLVDELGKDAVLEMLYGIEEVDNE